MTPAQKSGGRRQRASYGGNRSCRVFVRNSTLGTTYHGGKNKFTGAVYSAALALARLGNHTRGTLSSPPGISPRVWLRGCRFSNSTRRFERSRFSRLA